jgi:magnesium transporter
MFTPRSPQRLQESLEQIAALLDRHRVLEELAHKQEGPNRELLEVLQHRQNLADLRHRLRGLHPADAAFVLDAVPPEDRLLIWGQLDPATRGDVLLEVSRPVRDALLGATPREELRECLGRLDAEDLAYLSDALDPELRLEVFRGLDEGDLSWVRSSTLYPADTVGHLMVQEYVTAREDQPLAAILESLRGQAGLPRPLDQIYVVDGRNVLRGLLPLEDLLTGDPTAKTGDRMRPHEVFFAPEEKAEPAARAFERYDLVSAPVLDERGKLLGRLTVDAVMDFVREQSQVQALRRAGLAGDEDLYASLWASARNRWFWLALNLVTAFLASRVIGLFEETIAGLLALATLMPIVASIGGNTGNQTVALMIRGLALGQIGAGSRRAILRKELAVALLNGLVWGGVLAFLALLLYRSLSLSLVLSAAVLLNLMVAAAVGVATPLLLQRLGRDPAQGSSVLLTFTTDGMGFFIFLGLAKAFLT